MLTIDFSSLPQSVEGLEFGIDCPGKGECFEGSAGARFNALSDNPVAVWPGINSVRITVYEKDGQKAIYEKMVDPVPWDPPVKPNSCPTPGKAIVKL